MIYQLQIVEYSGDLVDSHLKILIWVSKVVSASIPCAKALEGFVSEEPHHFSSPPKELSINLVSHQHGWSTDVTYAVRGAP